MSRQVVEARVIGAAFFECSMCVTEVVCVAEDTFACGIKVLLL